MTYLLKNAHLLDAYYNQEPIDVLVEDQHIRAVGTNLPAADQEIDLTGYTLLPGFIDAHVHVAIYDDAFRSESVTAWAYNGVTTVRELGMLSVLPQADYAQWIRQNNENPKTAKVIATGKYIDVAGGYGAGPNPNRPVGNLITTVDQAENAVKEAYNLGFPGIKIGIHDDRMDTAPHLSQEMAAAICRQAASHGMWVAAHIGNCKGAQFMLNAGVRELAHTPGDPMPQELIAYMVSHGVVMDTTVGDPNKKMASPPPDVEMGPPPDMGKGFDPSQMEEERRERRQIMIDNLRRYYQAGGKIVLGTDLIHSQDFSKDAAIPIAELRALIQAGLSLQEAIQAGTISAAEVVGTGSEEGRIAEGFLANLVAVPGKVDTSFEALTHVKLVMHNGIVIRNEL